MTRQARSTSSLSRRLSALESDAHEEYPTASIARLLGASAVGQREGTNDIEPVAPEMGYYRMFAQVFYVPDWIPVAGGALCLDDEGRVLFANDEDLPAEAAP
jgi:hypothetical protein